MRLQRAQRLLREMVNDEVAVNVGALAGQVGVWTRSLQSLLQIQAGQTVMQAIREAKLLRANEILSANRVSVSQAAMACGFHHLGRFASMYESRIGQLPSQSRLMQSNGSTKAINRN